MAAPVKAVDASNGNDGVFSTAYFYEGLLGRTDGRGTQGFARVRQRDSSGIVSESETLRVSAALYATDWPLAGRPAVARKYAPKQAGYLADPASDPASDPQLRLVNRVTTSWSVRPSSTCGNTLCPSGLSLPTPIPLTVREAFSTGSTQESWELDGTALPVTTSRSEAFDAYGNPETVTVSSSDDRAGTQNVFRKVTRSLYTNDDRAGSAGNDAWILGRLRAARVTASAPGLADGERNASFTYQNYGGDCNAAPGVLCSETIEPGDSAGLWQETRSTYDAFGNRVSTTVSFRDPIDNALRTRTTTTRYDSQGRFPISTSNALGHTETRSFNPRNGAPERITGPNGQVTTFAYDAFGRQVLETVFDPEGHPLAQRFTGSYNDASCGPLAAQESYCLISRSSDGAATRVFHDRLQRERRRENKAFADGSWSASSTTYDALGRKATISKPAGNGTVTTALSYDTLGRVIQESTTGTGQSLITTTSNQGLSTTVTQTGTGLSPRSITKVVNSQGQTLSVSEGLGSSTPATTTYLYDVWGNLSRVSGPSGIPETMAYDLRGRKTVLDNPDSGRWTYQSNGLGELVRQTDAKGQTTRQFYDALGRLIERREHPGAESTTPFVTVWTYDRYADGSVCNQGLGKLCEVRSATVSRSGMLPGSPLDLPPGPGNSLVRQITRYDNAGRADQQQTLVSENSPQGPTLKSFSTLTSFDALSRVERIVHPDGTTLQHRYTAWSGQLDQLRDASTVHWQATARTADGQIATMNLGPQTSRKTYDGFGRVSSSQAGASNLVQNASTTFDALGNLLSRSDSASNQPAQTFGYDALNRLTTQDGANIATYDPAGNLQTRNSGAYTYQPGTHRVSAANGYAFHYDANGNVDNLSGANAKTLTYTPFNLPSQISTSSATLAYLYDGSHSRLREVSSTLGTTWLLGAYEEHTRPDGVVEHRHFLNTPEGAIGLYTRRSDGSASTRYWHKDHLGSLVALTDENGAVVDRYTYDAWGKRAHPAGTGSEERGYTGHEHLVEVGLTHMNGRIYFDEVGRFLQADPIVQAPYNGQSYNRYAYVFNNPLSFTDPSGFSAWTKWRRPLFALALAWAIGPMGFFAEVGGIAGAAGIATGTTAQFISAVAGGFAAGGISGGNMQSAVQGAFFAAAFYGAGSFADSMGKEASSAASSGASANAGIWAEGGIGRAAAHAVVGCAQSAAAGGSCQSGAASAGFAQLAGPPLAEAMGGGSAAQFASRVIVGGTASKLAGGSFQNGAVTAAFAYLFNYLMHVHRMLSMHGAARAGLGLTYDQIERLGNFVVGVDFLPNSQSPDHAFMHSMCPGGMGAAQCDLVTTDYRERMWSVKSIDGLARLLHLDQDSFAPMHRGGQSYSGFANTWEAIKHGWSDTMPPTDVRMQLIERSRALIRSYDAYCGGCVKNGLKGP